MRKGYVVKQKGYEYNDNWYDHIPVNDVYTQLFDDIDSATEHAKQFTADFIKGRSTYDYFNEQSYLQDLLKLVGDRFGEYDIHSDEFSKIWKFIKNDIAVILEAEILEDEPTVVNYSDGTKMYYKDNRLHRLDGPAIERVGGLCEYYYEGKRHRIDGPAIYNLSTDEYDNEFYIDGVYFWDRNDGKFKNAVLNWIQENRENKITNILS
jgi:hypothetical protein